MVLIVMLWDMSRIESREYGIKLRYIYCCAGLECRGLVCDGRGMDCMCVSCRLTVIIDDVRNTVGW